MIQMKNGIVHIRYCMISFISTEIIFTEYSEAWPTADQITGDIVSLCAWLI